MNKFKIALVLMVTLLAQAAMAADGPNIAVLDARRAIAESEEGKKKVQKINDELGRQEAEIMAFGKDAQKLAERLKKDGAVMSQDEKNKLEKQLGEMRNEFEFKKKQLQQSMQTDQQQMLASMAPKYEEAAKAVLEEGNYDMVIRREALLTVSPKFDITDLVIKKMNSM